jgi:hypothetical protein
MWIVSKRLKHLHTFEELALGQVSRTHPCSRLHIFNKSCDAMRAVVVLALLCCIGGAATTGGNQTDILINGLDGGTQLFDPYCTDKHATSNLK